MDINVILGNLKLASYSFWLGLIFSLIFLVLVIVKKGSRPWLILLVISIIVTVVSAFLMLSLANSFY